MLADVVNEGKGCITHECQAFILEGPDCERVAYILVHASHRTADGPHFTRRHGPRESEDQSRGNVELCFDETGWGGGGHGELEEDEGGVWRGGGLLWLRTRILNRRRGI